LTKYADLLYFSIKPDKEVNHDRLTIGPVTEAPGLTPYVRSMTWGGRNRLAVLMQNTLIVWRKENGRLITMGLRMGL